MKARHALAALGLSFGLVWAASCTRSPQYRQEQDTVTADPGSYYNRASNTPTQRVQSAGQPKKRVIVFNFWNDTPVKISDLGNFAADELKRGLHLTQRLILPADTKLELSTEDFIQGSQVKVAQLIREGRRLGVSVLVIGRISRIVYRSRGDEVGLLRQKQSLVAVETEIKVFDVAAGREVLASSRSGEASSSAMVALEGGSLDSPQYRGELTKLALRQAAAGLVGEVIKAVEKMTWEGRVAKVQGNKVYINAGKASGIVAGDILRVLAPGDDIYDPQTGAFLGRAQGQMKGTLEVVDFLGTDGAISELHTGGNIQEGDLVQLY